MAGVIRGALDLSESDRVSNLTYLANLLEDASDFNFESAKGCHLVVLTYMEHNKLNWSDMDELDRCRRQHAQRHEIPPSQPKKDFSAKKQDPSNAKVIPCRFFNGGHC